MDLDEHRTLARLIAQTAPRLGSSLGNITPLELAVLLYLEPADAVFAQMVEAFGLPFTTVHDALSTQVEKKRVHKTLNERDKRENVLSLTTRGRRLLRTAQKHRKNT